jgi:phosphoribosylaminoimidazole-succinocarboxamide synthase
LTKFTHLSFIHGYQGQDKGEEQKQLSKEFVRRWLIQNGFQGLANSDMTEEYIESVGTIY